MQFGLCCKPELAEKAKEWGFDYIEPSVSGIAAMTKEEFASTKETIERSGLSCPVFNGFFPGTIGLMGQTSWEDIENYLRLALPRVKELCGELIVFGSGGPRKRPESMSYDEAFRRMVEITKRVGQVAQEYGITLVIEPLNRTETNLINSLAEGAALRAAVNEPNVGLLCDYYHVAIENEPLADIVRVGGVQHVHIAQKVGRQYPTSPVNDLYAELFHRLKESGYTGRMSIEGGSSHQEEDSMKALVLLRKLDREN